MIILQLQATSRTTLMQINLIHFLLTRILYICISILENGCSPVVPHSPQHGTLCLFFGNKMMKPKFYPNILSEHFRIQNLWEEGNYRMKTNFDNWPHCTPLLEKYSKCVNITKIPTSTRFKYFFFLKAECGLLSNRIVLCWWSSIRQHSFWDLLAHEGFLYSRSQ